MMGHIAIYIYIYIDTVPVDLISVGLAQARPNNNDLIMRLTTPCPALSANQSDDELSKTPLTVASGSDRMKSTISNSVSSLWTLFLY